MVTKQSGIYRTLNIIGVLILFLLMVVGFSVYLLPHFGWRVDNLSSGSMEPELSAGDLVVTRPVEPEVVAVGDIITFRPNIADENLVTHRVIGIGQSSPLYFETKGDANLDPDPFTVPALNLEGRVYFHAPLVGYAIPFLKTTAGLLVVLVVPGLITIAVCMKSLRYELVKTRVKSQGKEAEEQKRE